MDVIEGTLIVDDKGNPVLNEEGALLYCSTNSDGEQYLYDVPPEFFNSNPSMETLNVAEEQHLSAASQEPLHPDPTMKKLNATDSLEAGKLEWTDGATRLLLDLYGTFLPLIGPQMKFQNRKQMFRAISKKLQSEVGFLCSEEQCISKYKSVIRAAKIAINHNSQSGSNPYEIPFEAEIRKISSIDHSIDPAVRVGVGVSVKHGTTSSVFKDIKQKKEAKENEEVEVKENNKRKKKNIEEQKEALTKNKKKKSLCEIFKEVAAEREKKKSERHAEKLELLREIINLKVQSSSQKNCDSDPNQN